MAAGLQRAAPRDEDLPNYLMAPMVKPAMKRSTKKL